jgi:glutamate racemase
MIKPAALQSKSRRVVVLATAATVKSPRYQNLITPFANGVSFTTIDTTDWARKIETGSENDIDLSEMAREIASGADIIVLACTHYLAIEETMRAQFPTATIIEPTEAVARRIVTLISQPQQ